ncbi:MAG: tripartite tricarboxylate transporter substrate binding protein, partial [Acidobacteria bacterium]|nr:tripartite tricarboxylate transporter substrate binding protein [Acidobacteriota bacterium]
MRRVALRSLRRFAALLAVAAGAVAARPIEIVVPIAPGGAADTLTRVVAEEFARRVGEPVVVLTKPGGGNTVAARYVLEQPADGRTLLLGTAVLSVVPHQKPPPFDVQTLVPVTGVYSTPSVLYVRASLPVNNLREFAEWARANPRGVVFGSTGVGSTTHIDAEALSAAANFKLVHVPYAGSSQTFTAMGGDHIDAAFGSPAMIAQAGKQGPKVKALMVGSERPLAAAPEVPPVDRALLGDFRAENWAALFVSARTPPEVADKLSRDLAAVMALPAIREKFASFLVQPIGGT